MGIFSENAPAYWAAGIPVIPLKPRDKMPIPQAWSQYGLSMPDTHLQEMWLQNYPDANLGLPAGPASGLVFFDVDTEDPKALKIIEELTPNSPWVRVGKKGNVKVFRYLTGQKKWQIDLAKKDEDNPKGRRMCELLALGQQVVLPPSIHPETQLPYTANCDLLSVLDRIPTLPKEFETILRGALTEAGYDLSTSGWTKVLTYVSVGQRDSQVAGMAGIYANAVTRGERSLKQAIDELRTWHANFMEKVAGDDIPVEKAVERLIHFINKDLTGAKRRTLPKGWDAELSAEEKAAIGIDINEEVVEWSFEQLKTYLTGELDLHANNEPGRIAAVNYILDRIVRSPSLDTIHEEMMLDFIAMAARLPLSKATLKKRLREMRSSGIEGLNHTEIAQELVKDFNGGGLRYHDEQFWKWGGSHWENVEQDTLQRYVAENFGHLPAVKKASDLKGVVQVASKLCRQELKQISFNGVNFANGVLGHDLKLRPHDPTWGMLYTLPFRYLPEGSSDFKEPTKFFEFLYEVWGHTDDFEDRIKALQEAMAVTLFGVGPDYMRAILLFGLAHSGKSQLLSIARALVPEEKVCAIGPAEWGDKFAPAQMVGKLMNFAGELSETKMIDGERFKQIVEGELISAQNKGSQIFHYRPRCAHWIAGNYLPKTKDTSEGFNRRWLILTFDKVVETKNKQVNIGHAIVAEEREAIVAWAVQAITRMRKTHEYTLPPSHIRAVNEMAGENDSVRFFITASGRVKLAPKLMLIGSGAETNGSKTSLPISARTLHSEYSSYCIALEGARPVGYRKFCQRMRELGSVVGFKQITGHTEIGTEETFFTGLIAVDSQGRQMSSSMRTNSQSTSSHLNS